MDYDVLVIGSGFGGSVGALRLTEKGYKVGVLEAGKRWDDVTLPTTSWHLRRFLWFPRLGLRGIQRLTLLNDVMALSGAGVGGGSLVWGNVAYEPHEEAFSDPQWDGITDWKDELAPFYEQARRMLGVVDNPADSAADEIIREVARRLGVEDTFEPTPVAVYFGEPGMTVPDPYFGGRGPTRTGCILCGGCMTGCRHNAKNRLDTSYLYLAERGGADVLPEHQAVDVRPLDEGGYEVTAVRVVAATQTDVHGHPGGLLGGHPRHRPASAENARCRDARRPVAAPWPPLQDELRGTRRSNCSQRGCRLLARRCHHLLVSPRSAYAHRTRPVRAR